MCSSHVQTMQHIPPQTWNHPWHMTQHYFWCQLTSWLSRLPLMPSLQKCAERNAESKRASFMFPDRGNFFRLYAQPCSVLNVMPKVNEWTWRERQFGEIKTLNQSKCQQSKDSLSKDENNSTSSDRENFFRFDAQPCSVLNVMPKVKERAWCAHQLREIKTLNQSKCQQPKDSPSQIIQKWK